VNGYGDYKLKAWGRWVLLNRGMGSGGLVQDYGKFRIDAPPPKGGHLHPPVPKVDVESARTNAWVRLQNEEDQTLLAECYVRKDTWANMADRRRISKRTLQRRLQALQLAYDAWRSEQNEFREVNQNC
jgi:hypothetical protein